MIGGLSKRKRSALLAVAVAALISVWVATAAGTAGAAPKPPDAVYVSTHASPGAMGKNCGTAAYSSIGAAVGVVASGGTVIVCPGTYTEDVIVGKPLTLLGQGKVTIDATGLENAIQVVSSDVIVKNFSLVNANGEGLLVGIDSFADFGLLPPASPVLQHVLIDSVTANNNNKGFNGTEETNCKYAGDCGGGIHLQATEHSTVINSETNGNADGILLTDDYGPTAYNLIEGNVVNNNIYECGIVLPGHNPGAVTVDAQLNVIARNPTVGGVFDNQIIGNTAIGNGTNVAPPEFGGIGGSGGGVGIFGSGPGTGAYDNLVQGNYLAGNGLSGVVMHAHHPGGSDLNGNVIVGNTIDTNNVMGDPFDFDVTNFATTGISIYSVPPQTMTITGNKIRNNQIGIWLTNTVNAVGVNNNQFSDVGIPIVVKPA